MKRNIYDRTTWSDVFISFQEGNLSWREMKKYYKKRSYYYLLPFLTKDTWYYQYPLSIGNEKVFSLEQEYELSSILQKSFWGKRRYAVNIKPSFTWDILTNEDAEKALCILEWMNLDTREANFIPTFFNLYNFNVDKKRLEKVMNKVIDQMFPTQAFPSLVSTWKSEEILSLAINKHRDPRLETIFHDCSSHFWKRYLLSAEFRSKIGKDIDTIFSLDGEEWSSFISSLQENQTFGWFAEVYQKGKDYSEKEIDILRAFTVGGIRESFPNWSKLALWTKRRDIDIRVIEELAKSSPSIPLLTILQILE